MFETFTFSDPGPYSKNEDSFASQIFSNGNFIGCVADGVGGESHGEIASNYATKAFSSNGSIRSVNSLREEIHELNEKLNHHLANIPGKKRSFTTFTGVLIEPTGRLVGVHVGDSRAMILRRSGILQLTADHTEANRLFREGKLTKDQLVTYPRKNVLSSALGMERLSEVQIFDFQLEIGDRVLLLTDGVHGKISKMQLRDMSVIAPDVKSLTLEIAHAVYEATPSDNYTIVAVEYF